MGLYLQQHSAFAAFKLMIKPSGKSFGRSRGLSTISLKCESELCYQEAEVKFSIAVGRDTRGPFIHNFTSNCIATLPEEQKLWELLSEEDVSLQTVPICLQVEMPHVERNHYELLKEVEQVHPHPEGSIQESSSLLEPIVHDTSSEKDQNLS